MDKKQFSSLVIDLIQTLRKEKEQAIIDKNYYEQAKLSAIRDDRALSSFEQEELQRAEKTLESIDQKIEVLKSLVNYPAYLRLQSLSNEELENYKKEKENEIKERIQSLESELKAKEEELERLKDENEKGAKAKYEEAYEKQSRDQTKIIDEQARKILDNILAVEIEIQKIRNEIDNKNKALEKLQAKSVEERKKALLSKVEKKYSYKREIDMATRILSSIQDPQKAQELAKLIKQHYTLLHKIESCYDENDERSKIEIETPVYDNIVLEKIKSELIDRAKKEELDGISKRSSGGWRDNYCFLININDVDKFIEIVNKWITAFQKINEINKKEITKEKLEELKKEIQPRRINESFLEKQIAFLTLHKEKIGEDAIRYIEAMTNDWKKLNDYLEKKHLLYGIIKKNETEQKLEELTEKLSQVLSEYHHKISVWYLQNTSLKGLTGDLDSYEERRDQVDREVVEAMKHTQQMIETAKEKKQEAENEKDKLQKNMEEVLGRIESIVGTETKEQIRENPSRIDDIEETIYKSRIINQVEEANKQLEPMSADEIDQMLASVNSTDKTGYSR